jgi:hypothetical protein
MPGAVVVYSPELTLPFGLIPPGLGFVDSNTGVVSHLLSEYSLKVTLPSPAASTRPLSVAVSLIFSPTDTVAVAEVVTFGVAFLTIVLSCSAPHLLSAGSLCRRCSAPSSTRCRSLWSCIHSSSRCRSR